MVTLPLSIGNIHFIGIGGIGMSGIAEVLHELGYVITGSDIAKNSNIERLIKLGISIKIGHSKKNVINKSIVVISSAINNNNIELQSARKQKIPIVHRSEMLSELISMLNIRTNITLTMCSVCCIHFPDFTVTYILRLFTVREIFSCRCTV